MENQKIQIGDLVRVRHFRQSEGAYVDFIFTGIVEEILYPNKMHSNVLARLRMMSSGSAYIEDISELTITDGKDIIHYQI